MTPQLQAFYLVVEVVSSPLPRPVLGPMPEADCRAVELAIQAAAVSSIASVRCVQPKVMMACELPGHPGASYPCPVIDRGSPLAGSW